MSARNSQQISIREAVKEDFDAVYGFVNALENTVFDKKIQSAIFDQHLDKENIIYLIAEQAGVAIGMISCHIQLLIHHSGLVAEIQELYVVPEKRGIGTATLLLDAIKETTIKKGVVSLEVTANKQRKAAHAFYLREGFINSHEKFVISLEDKVP